MTILQDTRDAGTPGPGKQRQQTRMRKWIALLLCLACLAWPPGVLLAHDGDGPCTIMVPDEATRQEWIAAYEAAPRAHFETDDFNLIEPGGSLSLFDHLDYIPAERNQGSCSNCWAWTGTGILGIALDVQRAAHDRLSVQYITSCQYDIIGKRCCRGGWLYEFADFHAETGMAVPWSNTNAWWQDGDASCDTGCSSVSTDPNYPITSIEAVTIPTQTVDQDTAIANIKNVLNQDRAIFFGFFLPDGAAWSDFRSFWNDQGEDAVYDMDKFCGQPYTGGGGHAVLCVGYNDEDPENPYWIMLNSWGTAGGDRPNGLFRIDMDIAYDCTNSASYSFFWQTLDVAFGPMPEISVSPGALDRTLPPDTTRDYIIDIDNAGEAELTFDISDQDLPGRPPDSPGDGDCPWLDEDPISGSVPPGGSTPVTVTVDTTGLDYGSYAAEIVVASNDLGQPVVTVPVTLHVAEPPELLRELPTEVSPGGSFCVVLRFDSTADDFNHIRLADAAPAGWEPAQQTGWCSPEADDVDPQGASAEISWDGPYDLDAGFIGVYQVGVPAGAATGSYSFDGGTLSYFVGGDGPYIVDAAGDSQVEVVDGPLLYGLTGDVACEAVTATSVHLFQGETFIAGTVSDGAGHYTLPLPGPGDYRLLTSREGFRETTRDLSVEDPGHDLEADLIGETGLPPNAPDLSYTLECVNHWLQPPSEQCALSMSAVLAVVNAWLFPV